jgi:hypothetical protein
MVTLSGSNKGACARASAACARASTACASASALSLTIIAVDPGHATLVDAVRYHPDGVHVELLPIDASRRVFSVVTTFNRN